MTARISEVQKWACCKVRDYADTGSTSPGKHNHISAVDPGYKTGDVHALCPDPSTTKAVLERYKAQGWTLERHAEVCYKCQHLLQIRSEIINER